MRRAAFVLLVSTLAAGCGAQVQEARTVPDVPQRPRTSEPVAAAGVALVQTQSVVDSAVRAFNAHDPTRLAALYAPDTTSVAPGPRGWHQEVGRASIENAAARLFAAFPDVTKTTTGLYTRGDTVAQEWTTSGTHSGEFMGVKATGRPVRFRAVSIYKIDGNGQISGERTYFDQLTLAVQIGLVKDPSRPPSAISTTPTRAQTASDSPSEARNEGTVRAFFAWLDGQRGTGELADILAPSAVFTRASDGEEISGLSAISSTYDALFAIFPDASFTVTDVIAAGEFVVAEVSMRGTQRGAVAKIPPTNRTVTLHRVEVFELHDSRITKACGYSSSLELRGQLDALPSVGGPS